MAEIRQQAQAMHQPTDIHVRGVIWGGVAIALGVMLAALASYVLWQWWSAPTGTQALGGQNTGNLLAVTPPTLQSAPQEERIRYFAEKQKMLDSYAWIDQRAGIARIPVEEAMRIMAMRGGERKATPSKEQP